jgi:hypothetical protein
MGEDERPNLTIKKPLRWQGLFLFARNPSLVNLSAPKGIGFFSTVPREGQTLWVYSCFSAPQEGSMSQMTDYAET